MLVLVVWTKEKMTKLSDLASDVLGQILAYDGITHKAIVLWICGDHRLQRALSLGVTRLEIQSAVVFENRRVPECIAHMTSIKEFSLSANEILLHGRIPISYTLEHLPLSLRKLELRLLPLPEQKYTFLKSIRYNGALVTLKSSHETFDAFLSNLEKRDSLETLILMINHELVASNVARLPKNLTRLRVCLQLFDVPDLSPLAAALPRSLLHLEIDALKFPSSPMLHRSFFKELPPSLLSLTFHIDKLTVYIDALSTLPRSLTAVQGLLFVADRSFPTPYTPPPQIESLHLQNVFSADSPLKKIAPHLRSLACRQERIDFSSLDSWLPPNVTDFTFLSTSSDFAENMKWPKSITSIHAQEVSLNATNLLKSIAHTSILKFSTASYSSRVFFPGNMIAWLPHSLTDLTIGMTNANMAECVFPPLLTALCITSSNSSFSTLDFRIIPRTVTRLEFSYGQLCASQTVHLPPRLTALRIEDLKDDFEEAKTDAFLARALELAEMAPPSQNAVPRPPSQLSEVAMWDLFPRTIRDLAFPMLQSMSNLHPTAILRLPPGVRTLSISGHIHPQFLPYLPTEHVNLHLDFKNKLNEEQYRLLPRRAKSVTFPDVFPSVSVVDAAAYTPTNAFLIPMHSEYDDAARELYDHRLAAFVQEDPTDLNRLLDPLSITLDDCQ